MADYKRMVSYMYQYENGVKRRNVGYARVEAKNGQCKITLHMQLLGQLDSVFPTYLIQRGGDKIELIYLGDTLLKNQVMDSKLSADEANIMGTGHSLSDMGGLLLFLNENIFFATEWDDKPIVAKEVLEALKPKQKKQQTTGEDKSFKSLTQDETDTREALQAQRFPEEINKKNLSEDINKQEAVPVSGYVEHTMSLEEELKIPKYKFPRGWKTVERLQRPLTAEVSSPYAVAVEAVKESEQQAETAQEIMQEKVPIAEQIDNKIADEINQQQSETVAQEDMVTAAQAAEEMDQETAKQFFDNYPRIYPFEDNEILLCVKIEPKDIGLLPKDIWAMSNNSFLMHGFYCYHHLIFAKMKDHNDSCYILGIPGIYHNRERFMARMFGFENFKSIRKRDLRQGDFGYWYLPIKL